MSKRNICFAAVAAFFIIIAVSVTLFAVLNRRAGIPDGSGDVSESGEPAGDISDIKVKHVFDRNLRGIWIASVYNIDYPSGKGLDSETLKAELDDIIETASAAGLNAVFFQVRPSSDALYASDIFPTSSYLVKNQGDSLPDGFDPLLYLINRAHSENISVHAWVNPVRVTAGSRKYPQTDLLSLSENNPARLNPEWVVTYNEACMYYNIGIPAARQLIADGVREIAAKYDVDGVVFDDYFYPYPADGAEFDDRSAYETYGSEFSDIGDFRRGSVNQLVRLCYDAIKAENPECLFGVSPFGIWSNDNGENGGSETLGLDAYNTIYCDALAWARSGCVDYIAPQLYWQLSSKAAPFGTLADWWNKKLSEYGIAFCISYAGYKTEEWGGSSELMRQIEYAGSLSAYDGGIIYGYSALKGNTLGLLDTLAAAFSDSAGASSGQSESNVS